MAACNQGNDMNCAEARVAALGTGEKRNLGIMSEHVPGT